MMRDTTHVAVYGFGSFFSNKDASNDVDLLILHESISVESCAFALRCKKVLMLKICRAHVTILSRAEELQLDFINKAHACHIGSVANNSSEADIDEIAGRIAKFAP